MRIGLISDTHGLLRPQAVEFLRGCHHILHAGDIGEGVLPALQALAPVTAVRGNNDTAAWCRELPEAVAVSVGGVSFWLLHDRKDWPRHPAPPGTQVVLCGHSHRPSVERQQAGPWIVNPGSAGPRRFKLPVTLGELRIKAADDFEVCIVPLV